MIKKWFRSFLILIIFIFCSQVIFGQYKIKTPLTVTDTLNNLKAPNGHYLKPPALIIPGTFLIYGGLKPFVSGIRNLDDSIYSNIKTNHPGFHTNAEEYLMWAPSASIYLLDAFKVRTQHTFKEHLIIDAGSIVITGGIGYAMRLVSRHINAYTTHNTEFPSGHTANAFRGAEIFHQELKGRSPLLSYSGYLVATSVGIIRIYKQAHLFTEVLAGAGLGILSTKLTYWVFDKVKYGKKRNSVSLN